MIKFCIFLWCDKVIYLAFPDRISIFVPVVEKKTVPHSLSSFTAAAFFNTLKCSLKSFKQSLFPPIFNFHNRQCSFKAETLHYKFLITPTASVARVNVSAVIYKTCSSFEANSCCVCVCIQKTDIGLK